MSDVIDTSGFRRMGIGVAVEHMKDNTLYLNVHVSELISDGEVVFTDNSNVDTSLSRGTTIKCRYYNMGSNRITPPTVRRGETIEIYQYGDSDQYHWRAPFYESKLRGLETLTFVMSNVNKEIPENHMKAVSKENSYFFTWSTIEKYLHLHTGTEDKEPLAWDFKLDTSKGYFKIWNTGVTSMYMDSTDIKLKGKRIYLDADEIYINGKKHVSIKAPTINAKGSNLNISGGTVNNSSVLNQSGSSNFISGVKMNGNASTTCGSTVI